MQILQLFASLLRQTPLHGMHSVSVYICVYEQDEIVLNYFLAERFNQYSFSWKCCY